MPATKETKTETAIEKIPTRPPEDFAILAIPEERRRELLSQVIGQKGLDYFDLDAARFPTGGIPKFTVQTLDGEAFVDHVEGVVVGRREIRSYWKQSLADGGQQGPPDCNSRDMVTGHGDPGGQCELCPKAEWGSGKGDRAPACQSRMILLLLEPAGITPLVINLPPTSVKPAQQYFRRLATKGFAANQVVTLIALKPATNAAKIEYVVATFKRVGMVNDEVATAFRGMEASFGVTPPARQLPAPVAKGEPIPFELPKEGEVPY